MCAAGWCDSCVTEAAPSYEAFQLPVTFTYLYILELSCVITNITRLQQLLAGIDDPKVYHSTFSFLISIHVIPVKWFFVVEDIMYTCSFTNKCWIYCLIVECCISDTVCVCVCSRVIVCLCARDRLTYTIALLSRGVLAVSCLDQLKMHIFWNAVILLYATFYKKYFQQDSIRSVSAVNLQLFLCQRVHELSLSCRNLFCVFQGYFWDNVKSVK